ncbi:GtrA family protein [Sphingomonas jatrophae]|uniref:Putative flippase GtrA (Transmembrane translocase of bactoprenol-linked glucose) n=1 Tax=Sphingomonas jatrophae TaxID=1166337 RepID=A0A1I6JRV4_9SPHN|nr:GtrA family protein [Sphingomonas jatrophae]SFR81704.1 Putative flippase GtrA (transmembrane translocase of bactoprenol-linked glucose) [Sphingomonas jatrophae]
MGLALPTGLRRFAELFRFYQAALVNTAFGFGTYALLVWLGLDLYVAQIIAQIAGVCFNYLTYSKHVFRDAQASTGRYILAYLVNYLVNLALLAFFDLFIRSPYAAGALATLFASLINYFALKHVVFMRKVAQ